MLDRTMTKCYNINMKKCSVCLEIKTLNDFEQQRTVCKKCRYKQKQSKPKKKYELIKLDKYCSKCKQLQPYTSFSIDVTRINGLQAQCNNCRSITNKKRYDKNSTEIKEKSLKYYKENKDIIIKKSNERNKVRRKTDPIFLLKRRLRNRLWCALQSKGWNKTNKFSQYIGCSQEQLKLHIETQFTEGMSWDNVGEWHIDHIIPLSSTDNPEELYKLCHYTNLQPMWALDNIIKGNK